MNQNRLATLVSVAMMLFVIAASGTAAPPSAPINPAEAVLAKLSKANGLIAKVEVALKARDWGLLRQYADEYVALMKSVTIQVNDLAAQGAGASNTLIAVQEKTIQFINKLKKAHAQAANKEAKDALAQTITVSQTVYTASVEALAKGRDR